MQSAEAYTMHSSECKSNVNIVSKHTHLAKRNIEEELLCNELRTQDSKSRVNRHNKELKENIEPKKFTSIKQEKPYRIKRTVTYMVEDAIQTPNDQLKKQNGGKCENKISSIRKSFHHHSQRNDKSRKKSLSVRIFVEKSNNSENGLEVVNAESEKNRLTTERLIQNTTNTIPDNGNRVKNTWKHKRIRIIGQKLENQEQLHSTLNSSLKNATILRVPGDIATIKTVPACTDNVNTSIKSNIIDKHETRTQEKRIFERIIDKKFEMGEIFFLVKWRGLPEERNTWEPYRKCIFEAELIREFEIQSCRSKCKNNIPKARKPSPINNRQDCGKFDVISTLESQALLTVRNSGELVKESEDAEEVVKECSVTFIAQQKSESLERNEEKQVIESILKTKLVEGEQFYLIKWLNNYPEETTWEPFSLVCRNAIELLREFERHPSTFRRAKSREVGSRGQIN